MFGKRWWTAVKHPKSATQSPMFTVNADGMFIHNSLAIPHDLQRANATIIEQMTEWHL